MKRLLIVMLAFLALHCAAGESTSGKINWNDAPVSFQKFKEIQQTTATFPLNRGIADNSGNMYVAGNNRLFRIDANMTATVVAGSGWPTHADGTLLSAQFPVPLFISIDSAGKVYALFTDRIRIIDIPNNNVTTSLLAVPLAATVTGFAADRTGSSAYYTLNNDNTVYTVDLGTGVSTAAAGAYGSGDVLGTNANARFTGPGSLMAANGNLFIVDFYNKKIKVKDSTNVSNYSCRSATTSMSSSLGVDGAPQICTYGYITSAYLVGSEVYFIESWSVIRKMNSDGSVTTFGKIYDIAALNPIDNIVVNSNKEIIVTSNTTVIKIKTFESK